MITLENVSTESFLNFAILEGIVGGDTTYKFISELLTKNNITNFKMLADLLEDESLKDQNRIAYALLKTRIKEIENKIAILKLTGKKSEIFYFNSYEKVNIDIETASITDKSNNGIVLPHTFPFINSDPRLKVLNELSIAKIKELLNSVDSYDLTKCALTARRKVGPSTVEKTLHLIDFYEQQVMRQALESEQRGVNLFTLNKEEKDKIISSNLQEYTQYILDNAIASIWGKISHTTKNAIYDAIISKNGEQDKKIKQALIDVISNYTTLKELETGILIEQEVPIIMGGTIVKKKTKPIDRFIL